MRILWKQLKAFKMKKILKVLRGVFKRRLYSLEESERIGFNRSAIEDKSRKKIQKEISNKFLENSILKKKEQKRKTSLKVLIEVVNENPTYYTQQEIAFFIREIEKEATV